MDEERLRDFLDAFNRHDLDAIMSFFTDDCVFDMPRGSIPTGTHGEGKAEVRALLAGRFSGIPDVHYGNDRHFIAGDRAASEWLLTGTTTAGQRIAVQGCDLFEFRGDKIYRKDSYWKIVER